MAIKVEGYEWFEYAGRKVTFHTGSSEHDLELSKGEVFGYRKWGNKHFIVDKSELGIRFEFPEEDVKKIVKSSMGWTGAINGVKAKAGIGGKEPKVEHIPEPPKPAPKQQRTPKEPKPAPVVEPPKPAPKQPRTPKEPKVKPVKTHDLTKLQIAMLRAIAENEHTPTNGAPPSSFDEHNWVWADGVISTKEDRGVFTSLNQLGLVKHDKHDMNQRKFKVILTKAGFDTYYSLRSAGHYSDKLRILNIESSMIDEASYDKKTKILTVDFKNGKMWEYHDVHPNEVDEMEKGEGFGGSQGKYFIAKIRSVKMQNPVGGGAPRIPTKTQENTGHEVKFRTTKEEFNLWTEYEQVNHNHAPEEYKPGTVMSIIMRSRFQNEIEVLKVLNSLHDALLDKKRPVNKQVFSSIVEKMIEIAEMYPYSTVLVKKRVRTAITALKKFL